MLVFVPPGMYFHPRLKLVYKTRAFLSEAPFRYSILGLAPGLHREPLDIKLITSWFFTKGSFTSAISHGFLLCFAPWKTANGKILTFSVYAWKLHICLNKKYFLYIYTLHMCMFYPGRSRDRDVVGRLLANVDEADWPEFLNWNWMLKKIRVWGIGRKNHNYFSLFHFNAIFPCINIFSCV